VPGPATNAAAAAAVTETGRIDPMLATLTGRRDFDASWIFERKFDGIRAVALRAGGRVRLLSRRGNPLEATYPELVEALAAQPGGDFAVDGEIVALDAAGRTDFALLQQRSGLTAPREVAAARTRVPVHYYLFDLLALGREDTTGLPLRERKRLLRDHLDFGGGAELRWTPHRNHPARGGAQALLDDACRRGWEGLIAKRSDARYVHRRSPDWLKLKCAAGQELVVGGFTEPRGSRIGFGALLLGHYERGGGASGHGAAAPGRLRYAGKVGTGYDTRTLRALRERLDALEQPESPFADRVREPAAHWVRPELVAQIAFTEWTRDGMLRHPRYLGLREDKSAREVVRETPPGR